MNSSLNRSDIRVSYLSKDDAFLKWKNLRPLHFTEKHLRILCIDDALQSDSIWKKTVKNGKMVSSRNGSDNTIKYTCAHPSLNK